MPESYVHFDYVHGRIGVRVEPKDSARALEMAGAIPQADRTYIHSKRLWSFRPKYLRTVLTILKKYVPNAEVSVEPEHAELLSVALAAAGEQGDLSFQVVEDIPPKPLGIVIGTTSTLGGS